MTCSGLNFTFTFYLFEVMFLKISSALAACIYEFYRIFEFKKPVRVICQSRWPCDLRHIHTAEVSSPAEIMDVRLLCLLCVVKVATSVKS